MESDLKKITLMDIKHAMKDTRFRETLPDGFAGDIQKYLNNPGCPCNLPLYKKILSEAKVQLKKYYPNKEIVDLEDEFSKLAQNTFSVINCHVDELESNLRKLPKGRKQIAVSRFEDQVTVIVNELDVVF